MNKKSFLWGIVTGVVLTFVGLFVIGLVNHISTGNDPIQYLEKPISYEDKKETSFEVFQVLDNGALAWEMEISLYVQRTTKTVLILGKNYYSDQIVTVKNPMRIGTFSYTSKGGLSKTVPVIDGEIKSDY